MPISKYLSQAIFCRTSDQVFQRRNMRSITRTRGHLLAGAIPDFDKTLK